MKRPIQAVNGMQLDDGPVREAWRWLFDDALYIIDGKDSPYADETQSMSGQGRGRHEPLVPQYDDLECSMEPDPR